MAKKTARVYTLDELKEKSRKALGDQKLVEIVKSTPLNKDGRVDLNWAYDEAEKYVHEQTKDLQKTKELAVATRFLAMLRRNHAEEFKKLVASEKQPELGKTPTKKVFGDIEFDISNGVELTTRTSYRIGTRHSIKFNYSNKAGYFEQLSDRIVGRKLCMEILNALIETADSPGDMDLMNDLIQLLEEKFGLRIKICENCKNYGGRIHQGIMYADRFICQKKGHFTNFIEVGGDSCEHWEQKIPEKPSST